MMLKNLELSEERRLSLLLHQYAALVDALNETMFELKKRKMYSNIIADTKIIIGKKQNSIVNDL